MARKGMIEHNEFRKRLAEREAPKRNKLKDIIKNKELPLNERFSATLRLAAMPRNGARNRYRTRCAVSGRPRAVYRFFGISRIALRNLAISGQAPGVRRSSW